MPLRSKTGSISRPKSPPSASSPSSSSSTQRGGGVSTQTIDSSTAAQVQTQSGQTDSSLSTASMDSLYVRGTATMGAVVASTATFGDETITGALTVTGGVTGAARGVLGYAEVVASSNGATPFDIPGLAVTVTVGAGRRIRISVDILQTSTVTSDTLQLQINEGATNLQLRNVLVTSSTSSFSVVKSPTTGSHTYKVTIARISGTGNPGQSSGATFPGFILVEDIGV
jgi:hypothetical protein